MHREFYYTADKAAEITFPFRRRKIIRRDFYEQREQQHLGVEFFTALGCCIHYYKINQREMEI